MEPIDTSTYSANILTKWMSRIRGDSPKERTPEQPIEDQDGAARRDISIRERQIEFAERQLGHDMTNLVARTVRHIDQTMESIGRNLDQMKDKLTTIRKQYPPFPPGSDERVELLRHFNLLRKQIDQLTIPADPAEAAQIMADPERQPGAGDWRAGDGTIFHHRPVHTGTGGLDIPKLPGDAEDAQIDALIKKLEQAKGTLGQRRNGLQADFMNRQTG